MYVDCIVCYVLLCCYRFLKKMGKKRKIENKYYLCLRRKIGENREKQ